MKKVLLISLLTVAGILFGMDATSTNVAHLVEIPSENSLMYQKFNAVAAQTIPEANTPPYVTNDTDIVHCYDALVNKIQKSGDIRYMYHDEESPIWYDLVGTNNLVLTSDSVYFTKNSVCLSHDDSGVRTSGLLLSDITYDQLVNEAKAKYGDDAYITVEICFMSDDQQNYALQPPSSSVMTYPNRHTLFNMGFRSETDGYVSQPGYFTLNNDTYTNSYVNILQSPYIGFATLSGYNVFTNKTGILEYRELINFYSFQPYSSVKESHLLDLYNIIYAKKALYLSTAQMPASTLVYFFSITNKTAITSHLITAPSKTQLTDEDRREDSFSLFLHGYYGNGNSGGLGKSSIIYEIAHYNKDDLDQIKESYTGVQYEPWPETMIHNRADISKTESYCSFGGKYTRTSKSIIENEMFYGHIYSIRIYMSRNYTNALSRIYKNVDIDRYRFIYINAK